jgi:hypothetical protein
MSSTYRTFLRRLPAAFLAGLVIWLLLRPALDGGVSWLAQTLIRSFEYPKVTRLVPVEHRAEVRRADFRADSKIPAIPLTTVHFNTIVLLALFLALPRPFSRRQLERLFMGWVVLFLFQTVNLVAHVRFMYATAFGAWSTMHYSAFARNFWGYLQYFTDLPGQLSAPFLIWIGFDWDLFTQIVTLRPSTAPGKPGGGTKKTAPGGSRRGKKKR